MPDKIPGNPNLLYSGRPVVNIRNQRQKKVAVRQDYFVKVGQKDEVNWVSSCRCVLRLLKILLFKSLGILPYPLVYRDIPPLRLDLNRQRRVDKCPKDVLDRVKLPV